MKFFILGIGEILIDRIDIPIVQSCTWRLAGLGYIYGSSGKYDGQYLHRVIAEKAGLDMTNLIDHKDMNRLNNQRDNLRPATHSQNKANRNAQVNSKSGIKGVSYSSERNKWCAYIMVNGKTTNLGRFDTIEEASEVRRKAEIKHFGEFARC